MKKSSSSKEGFVHIHDKNDPDQKAVSSEGTKKQKTPTSLTEQVLVGLLNDLFSSCVFRSIPLIDESHISLTKARPDLKKDRYMIYLKWTKSEIFVQSVSHKFPTFSGKQTPIQGNKTNDSRNLLCKMTRYGEKSVILSMGLATALRAYTEPLHHSNKIPISILNDFVDKEIYKGGAWAFNSLPVFLSSGSKDTKEQNERREYLLKIANEQFDEIQPSTIVSILWILYYMQNHKRFHKLCMLLCNEFFHNYQTDTKNFVYFLYLAKKMDLITNGKLEEIIYSHFNNVTILETLTVPDMIILTNIVRFSKNTTLTQKIITLLYYEIESMSKECAVFLMSGLTKMNFQFHLNDLFSKKLFSRILAVYDDITSDEQLSLIFYTMSTLIYDVVGYLNELISKTLTRLHMLSSEQVVKIGLLYALAINTSKLSLKLNDKKTGPMEIKDRILGKLESPVSKTIDHCLEFAFRKAAVNYISPEKDLLIMINGLLVHSYFPLLSKKLDKLGLEFGESWINSFGYTKMVTKYNKNMPKIDVNALEAQANNPAYSKCFKMFYLNLIDEFCNRTDEFKTEFLDQIVFSLLTLKIDLSPIHEAMLISKGESIRKNVGFVEIRIVESKNLEKQRRMAMQVLAWSRAKEGIDVLKIGDTIFDTSQFENHSGSVEYISTSIEKEVKADSVEKIKPDVTVNSPKDKVERHKKDSIEIKPESVPKAKDKPVKKAESVEFQDIVSVEGANSSVEQSDTSVSFVSVDEELANNYKNFKSKGKTRIENEVKKDKPVVEITSKKEEPERKNSELEEKVRETAIKELIKMVSKEDSSTLSGKCLYKLFSDE
ncbi:uncharacterized protein TA20135 [Theileria annulata]|uniref:Uncharacterized protein n=1 Tax=Theileria annulata TaxID=5874 RepID=Q4UHD0_THEAN|nr:uncharacterized protein TA20135 [Theileria annulata]CAI73509.1 hypothetical protein TA20135 [Theileria annulata]|eukprot:XP_954186.1 hypothetical protein TA20135 [Theileria annulata]